MCYYALHKLNKLPREILTLDIKERAFVYAAIDKKIKAEMEARKEADRKAKKAKGRRRRR
ncbi:MAG: hypothetical protein LBT44_01795 [Clostridiales bacterium]|nr:hypothetical protein [Clostridiales bacterium]